MDRRRVGKVLPEVLNQVRRHMRSTNTSKQTACHPIHRQSAINGMYLDMVAHDGRKELMRVRIWLNDIVRRQLLELQALLCYGQC